MATGIYTYANGKRKTSVARVKLFHKGTGKIVVNDQPIEEYFPKIFVGNSRAALVLVGKEKDFDIEVRVTGGGVSSQSDAVRHGTAKALQENDTSLRIVLKKAGYLTRDSRVKERRKYGLKKARKKEQFSKR